MENLILKFVMKREYTISTTIVKFCDAVCNEGFQMRCGMQTDILLFITKNLYKKSDFAPDIF